MKKSMVIAASVLFFSNFLLAADLEGRFSRMSDAQKATAMELYPKLKNLPETIQEQIRTLPHDMQTKAVKNHAAKRVQTVCKTLNEKYNVRPSHPNIRQYRADETATKVAKDIVESLHLDDHSGGTYTVDEVKNILNSLANKNESPTTTGGYIADFVSFFIN